MGAQRSVTQRVAGCQQFPILLFSLPAGFLCLFHARMRFFARNKRVVGGGGVTFVIVRVMPCVGQTFWLGLNGQLAINTNGSLANHTVATQQHLGLQFHKLLLICCDFHHLTTISRVYRLTAHQKAVRYYPPPHSGVSRDKILPDLRLLTIHWKHCKSQFVQIWEILLLFCEILEWKRSKGKATGRRKLNCQLPACVFGDLLRSYKQRRDVRARHSVPWCLCCRDPCAG